MQDKDPNEKEWYNIYMTHLFVSKMLRDKIDREMIKFSTVELAFKTIKTATVFFFSNLGNQRHRHLNLQIFKQGSCLWRSAWPHHAKRAEDSGVEGRARVADQRAERVGDGEGYYSEY